MQSWHSNQRVIAGTHQLLAYVGVALLRREVQRGVRVGVARVDVHAELEHLPHHFRRALRQLGHLSHRARVEGWDVQRRAFCAAARSSAPVPCILIGSIFTAFLLFLPLAMVRSAFGIESGSVVLWPCTHEQCICEQTAGRSHRQMCTRCSRLGKERRARLHADRVLANGGDARLVPPLLGLVEDQHLGALGGQRRVAHVRTHQRDHATQRAIIPAAWSNHRCDHPRCDAMQVCAAHCWVAISTSTAGHGSNTPCERMIWAASSRQRSELRYELLVRGVESSEPERPEAEAESELRDVLSARDARKLACSCAHATRQIGAERVEPARLPSRVSDSCSCLVELRAVERVELTRRRCVLRDARRRSLRHAELRRLHLA